MATHISRSRTNIEYEVAIIAHYFDVHYLYFQQDKKIVMNNSPFELAGGGEGRYADRPFLYAFASIL